MKDYGKLTDQELVSLLKQEDEASLTEIYNRYWKKLFTAAASKLEDLSEAEDIVQKIFINIWSRRQVIEITASLSSYLSVAVKYHIFKSIDKQFKQKQFSEAKAAAAALEIIDDSTQQWLEFQEIKERLNILIGQLPEKCRLVYKLSREEGYSQKRIAKELNISEKTVEAHISKALRNLKNGLQSFFMTL